MKLMQSGFNDTRGTLASNWAQWVSFEMTWLTLFQRSQHKRAFKEIACGGVQTVIYNGQRKDSGNTFYSAQTYVG
jgi:hypothetical protein